MNNFIKFIIFIIASIGVAYLINVGLDSSEVVRCEKLVNQSIKYKDSGFFITESENEMCTHHGIHINARILE